MKAGNHHLPRGATTRSARNTSRSPRSERAQGQQRELAEGPRRARDAEHDAPLVGGIGAPQRAENDIESRAAHTDADKDCRREA